MKNLFIFLLISGVSFSVFAQSDTINQTDGNSLRQGYWIIYSKANTFKEQEGTYADNKKEGLWKKYYSNGNLEHEITYVRNKPNGYAKFYYENGKLSEEGIWKGNKWIGEYKYYFKNGNPAYEWSYNEKGKRSGSQKYYHENGALRIEGDWVEGKENGTIKEYFENGQLKCEKNYQKGKMDSTSVKTYQKDEAIVHKNIKKKQYTRKDTIKLENFDGEGFHKLYTDDKQIEREGEFKNSKLLNGKKYHYTLDGRLKKISVYKYGKLVDVIYKDEE